MVKRKVTTQGVLKGCLTAFGCFVMLGVMMLGQNYSQTHYAKGTIIHGMNCSELTVEEAKEKIEKECTVRFHFADGTEVSVLASETGRSISDTCEFEEFLMKQNEQGGEEELEFTLTDKSFSVDESVLKECLINSMTECEISVTQEPQNAYINLSKEGYFEIIPEVKGNYLVFEGAKNFAQTNLKIGIDDIDFTESSHVEPEITSESKELLEEVERLNKILGAKIEYTLRDGSTYTLGHEVLKTWITQSESGKYSISIEEHISDFLNGLNEKVQSLGSEMEFTDRDGNATMLPVPLRDRDKVDIEAEKAEAVVTLLKGEEITRRPIYAKFNSFEEFTSWAEVDLKNQVVYLYVDGKTIVNAKPCVTGTANTTRETPKGVYYMFLRKTDKTFEKYGGHSDFWMQFTEDGIGFHDAGWRPASDFVPDTYLTRGSHGCINLQYETAKLFYENLTYDMPIIVH